MKTGLGGAYLPGGDRLDRAQGQDGEQTVSIISGETGERSGDIGVQVEFGQRSAAKKDGPSRRSLVAEYQRLTALVRYGARPHDAGGTREKLVTAHSAFQRAFQQAASTIRVRSLSQLPVRRAPRGPAIYMYLEAQYCRLSCGD